MRAKLTAITAMPAVMAAVVAAALSGVAAADPATPDTTAPGPTASGPTGAGPAPGPIATGPAPGPSAPDPTGIAPSTSDPAAAVPVPAGAAKTTIDADGTYAVGVDIVPGVYSTAGPVDGGTCYWKRSSNPDGATIDNALTKKPETVQVDPTDKSFKTNGCQPWTLTNAAPPPPTSPALLGLQLQAYMAQLNARAAASGQVTPP
jgi:hypothetical protein